MPNPLPGAEDRLLARILKSLGETPAPERVVVGPGDDAAVLRSGDDRLLLLTTDTTEEGVHFVLETHPPRAIGRRAVAAAVSDIAAMGGEPLAVLLSLVASPGREDEAAAVCAAAGERARELGAPLIGGNITASASGERGLGLHLSVLGAMAPGVEPLLRSGTKPGDGLFVTGELGGAALGLAVLQRSPSAHLSPDDEGLVRRHLDPSPRLAAGQVLAASGAASAAMDISDGLALDLHRLAEASGVGAEVEADALPLATTGSAKSEGGLDAALFGGEDYELLFTGSDADISTLSNNLDVRLTCIGRITDASEGICLRFEDGRSEPLPRRGWDSLTGRGD